MLLDLFIGIDHPSRNLSLPLSMGIITHLIKRFETVQGVNDSLSITSIPRRADMSAFAMFSSTNTFGTPGGVASGNVIFPRDSYRTSENLNFLLD